MTARVVPCHRGKASSLETFGPCPRVNATRSGLSTAGTSAASSESLVIVGTMGVHLHHVAGATVVAPCACRPNNGSGDPRLGTRVVPLACRPNNVSGDLRLWCRVAPPDCRLENARDEGDGTAAAARWGSPVLHSGAPLCGLLGPGNDLCRTSAPWASQRTRLTSCPGENVASR